MNATGLNAPATDVWYAATQEESVDAAVASLQAQLGGKYLSLILLFFSPRFDGSKLARALSGVFSPTLIVGCTSAGEFSPKGIYDGSIVAIGFSTETFAFAPRLIEDLSGLRVQDIGSVVQDAFYSLDRGGRGLNTHDMFAVMLADGLSQKEDRLAAAFNASLRGIPMVGGSAADESTFDGTKIYFKGQMHDDAAVLMVGRSQLPFCAFSCDHLEATPVRLVVTKADPERRIVHEFNALPAAQEYAAAVGLAREDFGFTAFASNSLAVRVGEKLYSRAIKGVTDGDGLEFLSAVDEGVVFTVARSNDIIENLRSCFDDVRAQVGRPQLIVGFECLFRRLEIEGNQLKKQVEDLYAECHVVGFNTYGEQFRAMHLNQTLTGLAIGAR